MEMKKEMRAASQAMRANVENDSMIIALKSPAAWAAGATIAALCIGLAHVACLAAAAIAGL